MLDVILGLILGGITGCTISYILLRKIEKQENENRAYGYFNIASDNDESAIGISFTSEITDETDSILLKKSQK